MSSNFKKESGEIATILTLGALVVMTVSSLVANIFLNNPQTVKTKAQATNCTYTKPDSTTYTEASSDGLCPENKYCNDNPNAEGCRGPCTRCFGGNDCRYLNNLWPFCSNNGCTIEATTANNGAGDKSTYDCHSTQPVPSTTSQQRCPKYDKNMNPTGQNGDECSDLAACTIQGICAKEICCIVNSTVNIKSEDLVCAKANGECASGFAWMPKSQLPKEPEWCTKDDHRRNSYGGCDQACCKDDSDCPTGEACTMANGDCKYKKSCVPRGTAYKRACVGSTCAWTSCNPKTEKCCGSSTDTSDSNYSSTGCLMCGETGQNACGGTDATTLKPGQSTYFECCAKGMAKKILKTCSGKNNTNCTYDCIDKSNKTLDCGGLSYLVNKAACVWPDQDSKISCKSPSLPSVSQLGSQQTSYSDLPTGDIVKTCSQYDNGKVIPGYDDSDKPINLMCDNVTDSKRKQICRYWDEYNGLYCGKCVPIGISREQACGKIYNSPYPSPKSGSQANDSIRGKLILLGNLTNIRDYNIQVIAINLSNGQKGPITTRPINNAQQGWLWDYPEITPSGEKIKYNILGIFTNTGTNYQIQSNIVTNVVAGDKNVDLTFGGAAVPSGTPTANKTFTITGSLINSKKITWKDKISVVLEVGDYGSLGRNEKMVTLINDNKADFSISVKVDSTELNNQYPDSNSSPTCNLIVKQANIEKEIYTFTRIPCKPDVEYKAYAYDLHDYDQQKAEKEYKGPGVSPAPAGSDKITIFGENKGICDDWGYCGTWKFDFDAIVITKDDKGKIINPSSKSKTNNYSAGYWDQIQTDFPCDIAKNYKYSLQSINFTFTKGWIPQYKEVTTVIFEPSKMTDVACGENITFTKEAVKSKTNK